MLTNVYVDGFNLYYGCLKGTPYRWLNLEALCSHLLPRHTIGRIRYFTAKVAARADDPQGPARQEAYLRALATSPRVSTHLGSFLTKVTRMPLANPRDRARTVKVIRTEEKGSDVNLATHLLVDAFQNDAEAFVVVSNDSDLTEPIYMVGHELKRVVGLVNPQRRRSQALLRCDPAFFKQIRPGVLAASQLPAQLDGGRIRRPEEW